ncbi:uncharacterized protein LOC135074984 [Ostrinia nubilalis]|uniref:uncharacterized protein LOC114350329 n=1 Tax=Ostrinia furnacalis TaxID=93504 RepID=UPI001038B94B|nr:uncharacterized protein LOC114350329 [Ostrinia furnacalis]
MANSFVQTCCLIVLTIFVERGDGRWKKKDGNLQHDIEIFRKMADKIEHEFDDAYDEYSSQWLKEQLFNSLQHKYKENWVRKPKNNTNFEIKSNKPFISSFNNNVKHKHTIHNYVDDVKSSTDVTSDANDALNSKLDKVETRKWPKFEDILLEVGKKYDWKNDRWIKVKGKLKDTDDVNSDNQIEFHEKHKFHYRIVKLNKSKSRRNVVVAVSAVR